MQAENVIKTVGDPGYNAIKLSAVGAGHARDDYGYGSHPPRIIAGAARSYGFSMLNLTVLILDRRIKIYCTEAAHSISQCR
jgi:hypothetical protein